MAELVYGMDAGRRWIAGQIPLKKNLIAEIDTRTGLGFSQVYLEMEENLAWEATKIKLPGFDVEDVKQELVAIMLAAIPDYSPEKAANLCTFLQIHLQKRIKNLYKHATEQCRTALARPDRPSKTHCNRCGQAHLVDANLRQCLTCIRCGNQEEGRGWKRFPIHIGSLSMDQPLVFADQEGDLRTLKDHITYEDLWISDSSYGSIDDTDRKLAMEEISNNQDRQGKLIVKHLMEGFGVAEICKATGFGKAVVRKRLAKAREMV